MKKLLFSKKVIVTLAGIIVAALAAQGWMVPEEHVADLLISIAGIVSGFNVGQGYADGKSRGATSAGSNNN